MVVWWLELFPYNKNVPGSNVSWGFACFPRACVGSLLVLQLLPTLKGL